eukprot:c32654_g1_i1 orf=49-231(+)
MECALLYVRVTSRQSTVHNISQVGSSLDSHSSTEVVMEARMKALGAKYEHFMLRDGLPSK